MFDLDDYPLFSPPEALAATPRREWTKSEAQAYFEWLMRQTEYRVAALLSVIGLPDGAAEDSNLLLAEAGRRVCRLLLDPRCSKLKAGGERTLTSLGYSLAADLGLLTAKQVQKAVGDAVKWEIVRRPPRDLSFNLPVLRISGSTYDPVGVSIADAIAVLAGRRTEDAWVTVFQSCVIDAKVKPR